MTPTSRAWYCACRARPSSSRPTSAPSAPGCSFAADACPAGSIYGRAKAFTPLLEEPLEGPVILRSSDNELPDMVFDLHGLIDFEAVFRIDSKNGGIRATFAGAPDAPLSKAIVEMQGGKKGLIVNSRNLCAARNRADVRLAAQNGKRRKLKPTVQPSGCKGKGNRRSPGRG